MDEGRFIAAILLIGWFVVSMIAIAFWVYEATGGNLWAVAFCLAAWCAAPLIASAAGDF